LYFRLHDNVLYACDPGQEGNVSFAFELAHASDAHFVSISQSRLFVALERADRVTIVVSVAELIQAMNTFSMRVVALVEVHTEDSIFLQICDVVTLVPFSAVRAENIQILALLEGLSQPALSPDNAFIAIVQTGETMVGGKRVAAEKLKIYHTGFSEDSVAFEIPDAFVSVASPCFSITNDDNRMIFALCGQRIQDSSSYAYIFALRVNDSGLLEIQSKVRLNVVQPVSIAFSATENAFVTCSARTNVFLFAWSEGLTVFDPVDVPHVCALRDPVFSHDNDFIAAYQDHATLGRLVFLKRIQAEHYMLHSAFVLPEVSHSAQPLNDCQAVIVQSDSGVLTFIDPEQQRAHSGMRIFLHMQPHRILFFFAVYSLCLFWHYDHDGARRTLRLEILSTNECISLIT
jgi:hypothetical protein